MHIVTPRAPIKLSCGSIALNAVLFQNCNDIGVTGILGRLVYWQLAGAARDLQPSALDCQLK